MLFRKTTVLGLAGLLFSLSAASAQEVRLNGATTVIDRVIAPHKAAVEAQTGLTLKVIGNATGRGLADLLDGKCDASLASEPLEIALVAAKAAGANPDPAKLNFQVVMKDQIVFVVHKDNPVRKLTWKQIKDIHTGKVTNWKDLGGKDAPITVYADSLTGGTRAMIKTILMEGADYGPEVKAQSAVKKVGEQVAKDPMGFGGLGKGFVDSPDLVIVETVKFERPLGFITVGAPTPAVAKVIAAFQTELKK